MRMYVLAREGARVAVAGHMVLVGVVQPSVCCIQWLIRNRSRQLGKM